MTDVPELNLIDEPQTEAPRRGFGLGAILLVVAILIIAFVVGLALARQQQTQPTNGLAPDFSVTTFDNQTINLRDLRGKIVLLNFWASWCVPCKREAPILQSVWEQYRDQDVILLGIAYVDSDSSSRAFIEEYGITYPNAPDVGTHISDAYNITGVPETFIIDRDGTIAEFIYAEVTEAGLTRALDRLLQS